MSTTHIAHREIATFADEKVNLKREDAKELREQANRLRDRLESYLQENPDFALRKMLLSGSLAKGTALKSLNDIDVAVYISSVDAPASTKELIPWLSTRLRQAFPSFKPEQIKENPFTITVSFVETGLRVDVVPILYDGDPDWKGHLMSKDTDEKMLTSIPMHIEFIRRRKTTHDKHFAQVVRLMKQWAKTQKATNPEFRFKSFMIELLVSHLADRGLALDDYPEALAAVFNYIATDAFKSEIVFADHYDPKLCGKCADPIRIWDPVNHQNNAAKRYTAQQRDVIVDVALDAGDAIDSAIHAPTKADSLRYWRKVFGPSFDA